MSFAESLFLPSQSYSPDPWTIRTDSDIAHILDADGREVAAVLLLGDRDHTNARLIAAAPDLFKACEDALAFMEPHIETLRAEGQRNAALNVQLRCDQLRAAFAKARGESEER